MLRKRVEQKSTCDMKVKRKKPGGVADEQKKRINQNSFRLKIS